MPFTCKFCGSHHLPENHGCLGPVKFKEERYAGRVGREIRRPLKERLL